MPNILFLLGSYPNYGGAEKVTTVLSNEFIRRGYQVTIASFEQPHPELMEAELNPSIEVLALHYPVYKNENIRVLKELLNKSNIDFIINQWCLPFYVTKLCKKVIKGTNCKLIAVHHNVPNKNTRIVGLQDELNDPRNSKLKKSVYLMPRLWLTIIIIKWSMGYVYRKSDNYVILSNSFVNIFKNFTGIKDPRKLEVIANPITIESSDKKIDKENVILYVGRIDYNQKRVHRVIEFWEQVYNNLPDWKLQIVGDGPEKQKLEQYVVKKNINNISFEGFQNPISYYQKAKILLLTSEYEGFGLVVVEAMHHGVVPMVYGSYSAVYDIIDNKINGIILPMPYCKEGLVSAMQNLLNDEELLKNMARNAKVKSAQFSLDKIMIKWEKLLKVS